MTRPKCSPGADHHRRASTGGERELRIALGLTLATMVIEMLVGWWFGSLALIADAGHMFADSSALALSLFAAWFSMRPATTEKTFGYYRTEILAALANGAALWLMVIWIYARAIARLRAPAPVNGGPIMAVAAFGLAINLLSGWLLRRGRSASLNVEGAWLNVMSDALGSVGVIIAGALIWWRGWIAADPIASMVIGVLIALNSWTLISRSINILLEGTPSHVRIPDLVAAMRGIPGVREVHDVHLWTITTGMDAMSGHIIVDDIGRSEAVLAGLQQLLADRFSIAHTTLQLEPLAHVCPQH